MTFFSIADAQYTKLIDFNGTNGGGPYGSLISYGNFLYGMTTYGSYYGNIFKTNLNGTGYSNMHNFNLNNEGGNPNGSLISDSAYLYGIASQGGYSMFGHGAIFKIKHDGSGMTILHNFSNLTYGISPFGSLIFVGTNLYGMTGYGGVNSSSNFQGDGTIFKLKTDGSGDTIIFNFNGTDGSRPQGSLVFDGAYLFGMTCGGGIFNTANGGGGTIFKIKPDGTDFTKLLDFANDTLHGILPLGSLIYDGAFLYGMTSGGGINNMGTVFKIKPDGSGYVKLLDFNGANGSTPRGSLIFEGNYLYGMTYYGGIDDKGVIFRINPDGCWYSKLFDFSGYANGANPGGDLFSDGTFLYGMTSNGGTYSGGTMFKFLIPGHVVTQSLAICLGQSLTVGPHTYYTSGNYMDTLNSLAGCGDSLVATHLTVLSSASDSSTQTLTICSGQSVTVGTDNYTTAGTYTYSFQGGSCDSTVTTILTVNPSPNLSISGSTAICAGNSTTLTASGGDSYNWNTGSTVNSITEFPATAQTYSVIATIGSCSDTSSVLVTVDNPPVAAFTSSYSTCCENNWVFNDSSYTAISDTIVSWNWNLPGGSPSQGSSQSISTIYWSIGFYNVCLTITTAHGCTDSVCHTIYVFAMSVINTEINSSFSISPNPVSDQLTIELKGNIKTTNFEIFNSLGQIVHTGSIKEKTVVQTNNFLPGVYFIKAQTDNGIVVRKFIKE